MAIFAKFRIPQIWIREFLSEFMGTFVLVLIGESSMANLVLKKENDVFAAVFCWGVAVMMGILTGFSNSGGHVNPAVTTSLAALGKFPWTKVPHYILGQHLGSFAACALLYGNNRYIMDAFDGGNRSTFGPTGSGVIWTTFPDPNVTLGICVLDTIICSGMLMFGILVILDRGNAGIPGHLAAFHVGLLVVGICWGMGANCMAGVNPARDFPPRVLAALVGYKDVFSHRNFWWIPLLIPHVGGTIASYLYEVTIGVQKPTPEDSLEVTEIHELRTANAETKAMITSR